MTSTSDASPLTSENWAISVRSISIEKRVRRERVRRQVRQALGHGLVPPVVSVAAAWTGGYSERAAPPENWAMRKTTNSAGLTGAMPISTTSWPGVDDLGRVVLRVALDVERLARRRAEQRAVAPDAEQERVERPLDALPEVQVVRLEDDPLGALEDRLLDVVEEAADVEVAPRRIARQRPRAPDPDAPPGERPDAVDAGRVELVVLALGDLELQRQRAADRPRWPGALWTPRVSSLRAQMPAMWPLGGTSMPWRADRVEDLDPGPVEASRTCES